MADSREQDTPTQQFGPKSGRPSASGALPREFADYRIEGEVGRGGMGVVYRAYDPNLHRVVALKVLLGAEHSSEEDVQRFFREAESAAGLQHPNIVPVHELSVHQGRYYFTMDFIEGRPLDALIAAGELNPRAALELAGKVARALDYAHGRGVVHRDLKPANILVDAAGEPKVTDFGLAKVLPAAPQGRSAAPELTASGVIMGTPSYMAPEQAEGRSRNVDGRTDVYALGCVIYEMLTGAPPFSGASAMDTLTRHVNEIPERPSRHGAKVARDVEVICLKCLEKEPGRRYRTAGELAADIRRFLDGEPVSARPASAAYRLRRRLARHRGAAAVAGVALVLLAAALSWAAWRVTRERELGVEDRLRADELAVREQAEAAERRRRADEAYVRGKGFLYQAAFDRDETARKHKRFRQLDEAKRNFAEALSLVPDHLDALGGMVQACNEQWRLASGLQLDLQSRSDLLRDAGKYARLRDEALARRKR